MKEEAATADAIVFRPVSYQSQTAALAVKQQLTASAGSINAIHVGIGINIIQDSISLTVLAVHPARPLIVNGEIQGAFDFQRVVVPRLRADETSALRVRLGRVDIDNTGRGVASEQRSLWATKNFYARQLLRA